MKTTSEKNKRQQVIDVPNTGTNNCNNWNLQILHEEIDAGFFLGTNYGTYVGWFLRTCCARMK